MLSFHNFFYLIQQKDAFLSPMAHKKTEFREKKIFMIIFVIVFLILPQIQSIQTPPSPYYNYSPQLIQSGKVNFIKGTSEDNDPSTVFSSTYTVTLTRMKNTDPSDYLVIVGYKHMHIDVITYTPAALSYLIYCYNKGVSSFQCLGYSSYEALFTRYQLSYMTISKKVGNIYLLDKVLILNKILVYPVYEDFVITDSSIKQIGRSYHYVLSVYHFYTGVVTTANPNAFLPQLVINSTSTYTIRMYSNGLFLYSVGVQVLLFDPALVNDLTRTNIIITHHYNHPGPVGNFDAIVYSYSGILMSSSNAFVGLQMIYTMNNKINYDINFVNYQLKLTKLDTVPYMSFFVVVFLKNICPDPYYYKDFENLCAPCPSTCTKCDQKECYSCVDNFTLSNGQCNCEKQLVSGICYEFDQSPMKGCISASLNSSGIYCSMCSISQKLILINNQCVCKDGYKFDSNGVCAEVCGDKKIFDAECDDGNSLNGDGCSEFCKIQSGFKCDSTVLPSQCKFIQELMFQPISIMKNKNNSAVINFGTKKKLFFDIKLDQFLDETNKTRYKLNLIDKINNSLVQIDSHLMSVQDNQISILINYDFTIQCQKSRLELNFTETRYLPDYGNYIFRMCGTNQPLIHSQYTDLFMTTEYVYLGIGALMVLLLCTSFYSSKYIGLQAILTLQLIYYSCLLVKNLDLMPPGFRTFVSFKYSTGFNQLFKFTKILITGDLEKKIVWINLEKTIIENYNTSFVILVLSSIFMVVGFVYRKAYQGQFEGRSDKFSNLELKNIQEHLKFSTKINQLSSSIYNQVSVWSILQIIAAVSLQLLIDPKSTLISEKSQFFSFQPLIAIVSVFLVIWAGLSNLKNLLHSDVSWGKYIEQMNVLQYRRLNFMYLVIVGFVIFFLNQKTLFQLIPASTIVLAIHLLYIILLHVINPYQHSLNVHKYGLYFCQIVYLLFLVCVNVINFASNLNEILILGFVYFIVFCCAVIVIFTIVRLYYEYKYGEKLEKKIQKERQLAKQAQIEKQEAQILRRMKKLQNQITSSLTKKQQKRIQNVYLLQNQIRQELMVDQIEFLDRRPQLNQQQKQIYYFKKFHVKPLHYLKKNNIQEFNKRLNELSEKKKADQQKRQLKKQDPNYVQVTQRLKKQLHQLSRVQNCQAKSMKKKTQKSTYSN